MGLLRLRGRCITAGGVAVALSAALVVPASAAFAAPAPQSGRATPSVRITTSGTPAATSFAVSATGSVQVLARGNGHGHGMSQWGAEGAAVKGLSYRQILAFYYRHTTLATTATKSIRVRLSGFGNSTTVAAAAGLAVTGVAGQLPVSGVQRYRLVADASSGLDLQQLPAGTGASWRTYRAGLANHSAFWSVPDRTLRMFASDGSSTLYYGRLRANRSGSGLYTVDKVSLDRYTAGVVPSEMPTSWARAAVDAQAVAARTYGLYAVQHPESSRYDICDTTSCQVYGGAAELNSAGQRISSQFPAAAKDTAGQVLTYGGDAIFAQFSASNGGWEDAGGQPYLVSQRDPYDTSASGDPWAFYKRSVRVASIAAAFGMTKLSSITIAQRDGNGAWGGRVESVTLTGTSGGKPATVHTDGYQLEYALGLGTTLYTLATG